MTLDRTKLIKVLGMLGSAHDGEALAAARRAQELIRAAGMTWAQAFGDSSHDTDFQKLVRMNRQLAAERSELLEEVERLRGSGAPESDEWIEPETTREKVDLALQRDRHLTDWERDFLTTLTGWRGALTPKQQRRLDELIAKLRRIARARESAQW